MASVNPVLTSLVAVQQKPRSEPVQENAELYRTIQMQKEEEEQKSGTATDGRSKGDAQAGAQGGTPASAATPAVAAATAGAGAPGDTANRLGDKGLFDPFNSGMSSFLLSAQEAGDEPEAEAPKPDPLLDF